MSVLTIDNLWLPVRIKKHPDVDGMCEVKLNCGDKERIKSAWYIDKTWILTTGEAIDETLINAWRKVDD